MESIANVASLSHFLPELILCGAIILVVVIDMIAGRKAHAVTLAVALIALGLATLLALRDHGMNALLFSGMIAIDPAAVYAKLLFFVSTALVLWVSFLSPDTRSARMGEYTALVLTTTLGMSLMASSVNMLMMVVAMETVSIPSYVLAGYLKSNRRSCESALKYVIYGAASTGVMLYGMSIIFGVTGSASIFDFAAHLGPGSPYRLAMLVAVGFVMAGLGFKISAVPFHFWTPDVYEGAPTPIAAFLSVASKAAGFVLLLRFFFVGLADTTTPGGWVPLGNIEWPQIIAVLAAATMTLGNLSAIPQNNLKRLLAYSTIAHAGYMLMGFVVLSPLGMQAVLFYLGVYLIMNLGAFFCVIFVCRVTGGEDIAFYRGLGWRSPFLAVSMAIFLFSLVGLPPFAGFIGKLYIFAAVIEAKVYWLAIVGILNSAISLYYYARVIKAMFLRDVEGEDRSPLPIPFAAKVMLVMLALPTLLLGVYWSPLWNLVARSAAFVTP